MDLQEFYVTLPSNVPYHGRENTCASYLTPLPERKRLEGKWKVGLVEVSYTFSWWNVFKPSYLHLFQKDGEEDPTRLQTANALMPPGCYTSIASLAGEADIILKSSLKLHKGVKMPSISLDNVDHRVVFNAGSLSAGTTQSGQSYPAKHFFFHFDDDLMSLLGFDLNNREWKKHGARYELKADRAYDLRGGIHALYVESDIIRPVLVGNTYANVLKVVEVPPSSTIFGEQMTIRYSNPQYLPLQSNEFDRIVINIKDGTGELIPFQFGHTVTTLHFVKENN